MERYTDSQTWYCVFDKAYGLKKWWQRFLHKDFQHVHLIRDNRDYCLMVNSMQHVMAVREYPNTLEDILAQEIEQSPSAILMMTVHYGSHYKHMPLEPLTCVTVAKRLLGINARAVQTPRSLYCEMLKAGATVIKGFTPA